MNEVYKQIGNAVPVNLGHAVARQVVRSLNEYEVRKQLFASVGA